MAYIKTRELIKHYKDYIAANDNILATPCRSYEDKGLVVDFAFLRY